MNSIILDPSLFLLTPPMDLNHRSRGTEPISSLPLKLRTDRSIGLFGARRDSESLIGAHIGVDLLAPANEEVFASGPGVVVQVGPTTTGWFVTIHHFPYDLGIVTSYRHMQSVVVTKGEIVASGKLLGQVVAYSASTPSHLHFELRQVLNESLLAEYLVIYRPDPTLPAGGPPITHFDLSKVSPNLNLGDTWHSLPLNPTRSLYNWEKNGFKNDPTTRHLEPRGKLTMFNEIVRDRMLRFVRVQVANSQNQIFLPLLNPTPDEVSLIETLRAAFFRQSDVELVWRDSLFFSDVQPPKMKLLVELVVHQ